MYMIIHRVPKGPGTLFTESLTRGSGTVYVYIYIYACIHDNDMFLFTESLARGPGHAICLYEDHMTLIYMMHVFKGKSCDFLYSLLPYDYAYYISRFTCSVHIPY